MPHQKSIHLAIDLGAGSGRVLAGVFQGEQLALEVVHRFENPAIEDGERLFWGLDRLWQEILKGLTLAATQYGAEAIESIGVDTWGVDYVLLDEANQLLAPAHHYRDSRTEGAMDEVFAAIPREEVFQKTGIQFLPFNTLYQFHAEQRDRPELLEKASRFLLIADYFNLLLSGVAVCERTNASTTQLLSPEGDWVTTFFSALGIDPATAPPLIEPGEDLGALLPKLAAQTGLSPQTRIITVGSHDTASAVAAVPAEEGSRFAYLSSGTWSLLGAELNEAIVNEQSLAANFTNETGICGTTRFLKNINGLYLIQECRRVWSEEGSDYSFAQLAELAQKAPPLTAFIDPDHADFTGRGNLPAAVCAFCQRTGQPVPQDHGTILRVISDSLALKTSHVLKTLESLVGHSFDCLHIIGGGAQNTALNQAIANSTQLPCITGPYEATALGNILVQLMAAGKVTTHAEARSLLKKSEALGAITPADAETWNEAYARFVRVAFEG